MLSFNKVATLFIMAWLISNPFIPNQVLAQQNDLNSDYPPSLDPALINIQTRWRSHIKSQKGHSKASEYFAAFLKMKALWKNREVELKGNGYLSEPWKTSGNIY